jgi:hypothetical protein
MITKKFLNIKNCTYYVIGNECNDFLQSKLSLKNSLLFLGGSVLRLRLLIKFDLKSKNSFLVIVFFSKFEMLI